MKKAIALTLAVLLALSAAPALAAGKLSVTQENFYVVESYSTYGYAFARVENTGDKPIKVNAGLLEIYDEAGGALISTDYISAYAAYLQPGEYAYVKAYDKLEDGSASAAADYMLTLTGKSAADVITHRLPCTTDYQENVGSGYFVDNYMYATFTNDTDAPLFDISVVLALLDGDGNILYIDEDNLYSSRALMPGSAMMVCLNVDSDFVEYFEKEGIVPARVDAIAYAYLDQE